MRDVCSTKLLAAPIILGGPGKFVQTDDSLFVHTRKVATNHITFHSYSLLSPAWSWLSTSTGTVAVGYMELVQDRTAATLLTIISAHVAPGIEIWSDQWALYHNVGRIPGVTAHRTVNHSIQFVTDKFIYYQGSVDLILHCFIASGVRINTMESYWNRCKTKIKRMKGVHRSFLPS